MGGATASAIGLAALFGTTWLISLPLRNAAIVDAIWSLAFVLVAWTCWALAPGAQPERLLLPILVTVWGVRLSLHLALRAWGEPEDPRYQAMRAAYPPFWLTSLPIVYVLQGVLAFVISLPLQRAQAGEHQVLWPLAGVGIAVWAAGLLCESIADWQLKRFKADPANAERVLDTGLWRYSRHPNYFGDFVVWWGLFLVGLACGAEWWTVVAPLIMSGLLMKVSGVPLLERRLKTTRPKYADYVARTSAFFPRPPRSSPTSASP